MAGYTPTNIRNNNSFALNSTQAQSQAAQAPQPSTKACTYVFKQVAVPSGEGHGNSDPSKVEGEDEHWCKICDLKCTSKQSLEEHMRGKKHKRKRYLETAW